MFTVLNCLVIDHDARYTAAAVTVCVLGSLLAMRLFYRGRRSEGLQRINWLFLAGMIGGATIWTTHFVAMLGYQAAGTVGYDPYLTGLSFLIAVLATMAGFSIAAYAGRGPLVEAGGVIVGLGIAAMHYTGMAAYLVKGSLEWDRRYVVASLILAAVFGALAANRVVRPISRFCRYGGVAAFILAIATTHFTGMASLTLVFDPAEFMPDTFLSSSVMGGGAIAVTFVLLTFGLSTYMIDSQSTQQAVERYRHLSLHDPLTGLANRTAFHERLQELFNRKGSHSSRIALLSFDLDRFKEINDVHGHAAGDAVLRALSDAMSSVLRPGEFLARVGGDEFVAMTTNYYSRNEGMEFANRLHGEICKPVIWSGQSLSVGASIGIAVAGNDNLQMDMDALVAQADVAMYRAKAGRSGTVCFYDKSMDEAARERNALAMSMRTGLKGGQFELYYQQQNDTATGSIVGFEALLRWDHPQKGMISPTEFIPIAEKNGFIIELGEWVLQEACKQAVTWKNPLSIAVNVAPQQLADIKFPSKVQQILEETGLEASRLELEITESGIIADHQHALFIIRKLKALGVRIAMDDYGTGYSSLSTLQSFPFDKIKIDRAFVDGVASNAQSAAIVRSTLILAHSLNIPVLAEGVETEAHMDFLRREGCLQVQGFFFGKPVPVSSIDSVINRSPQTLAGLLASSSLDVVQKLSA
jgi:diguanylate cyclase (GGDEF)-like protein